MTLLVLLGTPVQAGAPDTIALTLARSHAALAAGDPEGAAVAAAAALAHDDTDWRAWWAWRESLLGLDAGAQLAQEAELLAADPDPWRAWVGRTWGALAAQELPTVDPAVPGTVLLAAHGALAQGRPQRALDLLGGLEGPAAQGVRLAALSDRGQDRAALGAAKALRAESPAQLGLLGPACGLDVRGATAFRRDRVRDAAETLDGDNVLAIYGAHTLLVACDEVDLALAASARLQALGEPVQLGGRHPWGGPMIRDLGRVLAMQRDPQAPLGGTASESQRVLVATARELQERGRTDQSLALWRQAMGLCDPPPALGLEAAEVERRRGDSDAALGLARDAREALVREAVDPGEQGRHRRLTADSWRVEAQVLQAADDTAGALWAAGQAASVAGRTRDLVLWGELLEISGEARAALQAYSRAAAQGHRGLESRLERLYDGPADAEAVVAAWRITMDQDPRSHAVQEARGARLPARTLATTAGPLRIGDPDGEWLVVNFWASWCGPCQRELPELAELAAVVEAEGLPVRILAVSVDDRRGEYEAWISDRETGGLILAWDPDLGRALQLRSIPTTLLVDPQGLVQETRRGYKPGDGERLLAELRPHLEDLAEE
jgi:thiol-disulfide isomerase/thioredoxin